MKKLGLMLVVLLAMSSILQAKTERTQWRNYGYCASTDTWDANALTGSNTSWANLNTNFTTLSDPNNHILWIVPPEGFDFINMRFRASAVNTAGTFEILQVTYAGDAEYCFDLALTADASAMPATSIVDGNDTSTTIIHGGYYFGNIADSNTDGFASTVVMSNCDTTHRMCVYMWDFINATTIIVHPKSVSNGTIYWDACFWREEPK